MTIIHEMKKHLKRLYIVIAGKGKVVPVLH